MATPGKAKRAASPATARSQRGDELAAGRGRHPLDRRDHRLRQGDNRLHQRSASGHDELVERLALIGVVAVGLDLAQVVAGAQRRAFPGHHDDARGGILGDVGQGHDQRVDHGEPERVAVLTLVERQGDDARFILAAEESGRGGGGVHAGSVQGKAFGQTYLRRHGQ